MHWGNSFLLICFLVLGVIGVKLPDNPSSEMTFEERMKYKPLSLTVLPPGLPHDLCSLEYGGSRGDTKVANKTIVKKLEKRGWVQTGDMLPRQVNSVHICCYKKKFGMEIFVKDPKLEKAIAMTSDKAKNDSNKWMGIVEAENPPKKHKSKKMH